MLGVVLTGGASRRMGPGIDKALIEVEGTAMVTRVASALRAGGAGAVVCVGGNAEAFAGLGLDAVPDRHPAEGPLGGLCTALCTAQALDRDTVVVAACDQYRLDGATVAALLKAVASQNPSSGVVAVCGGAGRPSNPLPMAARVGPVAPVATAAFAAGDRSLRALLDRTGTVVVEAIDPATLVDADEPDDLP